MRLRLRTAILPVLLIVGLALTSPTLHAQDAPDLEGSWSGALDVQGTTLRLVFNVSKTDDGYSTVIISLDQGNIEIPTETTTVDGLDVLVTIPLVPGGGEYLGTFSDDHSSIDGMWSQGGNAFPLVLERAEAPGPTSVENGD